MLSIKTNIVSQVIIYGNFGKTTPKDNKTNLTNNKTKLFREKRKPRNERSIIKPDSKKYSKEY